MSEEQGLPVQEHRIKLAREEKAKKKIYKVVKTETITKNGKVLKKETMSDGSKRQVYVGKAEKKGLKKIIDRD